MDIARRPTVDRRRKREAEREIALAEASKPRKRDGADPLLTWSIVGLFVIALSAAVYAMEAILMPIAFAVIIGIVLGRAADELERFGLPRYSAACCWPSSSWWVFCP